MEQVPLGSRFLMRHGVGSSRFGRGLMIGRCAFHIAPQRRESALPAGLVALQLGSSHAGLAVPSRHWRIRQAPPPRGLSPQGHDGTRVPTRQPGPLAGPGRPHDRQGCLSAPAFGDFGPGPRFGVATPLPFHTGRIDMGTPYSASRGRRDARHCCGTRDDDRTPRPPGPCAPNRARLPGAGHCHVRCWIQTPRRGQRRGHHRHGPGGRG